MRIPSIKNRILQLAGKRKRKKQKGGFFVQAAAAAIGLLISIGLLIFDRGIIKKKGEKEKGEEDRG